MKQAGLKQNSGNAIGKRGMARATATCLALMPLACGTSIDGGERTGSDEFALRNVDPNDPSAPAPTTTAFPRPAHPVTPLVTDRLLVGPGPDEPLPLPPLAPPSGTTYEIIDLGAVGPEEGNPLDPLVRFHINESGAVIWTSDSHGYFYRDCELRDIGHLGGDETQVFGLNNSNVVVGKSTKEQYGQWRAFSWFNGSMRDLGGEITERALAINNLGDIVGMGSVGDVTDAVGVRYQHGGAVAMGNVLLNPPQGWANAPVPAGINDKELVVGTLTANGTKLPFLSKDFGATWQPVIGVASPSGEAFGINRDGHVVGRTWPFPRAFLSCDPTLPATDLTTLGGPYSTALGLNDRDWVVGWADRSDAGTSAFVYDGSALLDLNTKLWSRGGWELIAATGINNAGQIVGEGRLDGVAHGFLLRPTVQPPFAPACLPNQLGVAP